jgi:dihydroorotate dehydrogenase (NAD+) catalytic subunit
MVNLGFDIAGLHFKNPVMTASGTCGFGTELEEFFNVGRLGAIVIKGTTLEPRAGNPYPRMAETPSGMLNSVGLQNKGIDFFESDIYPKISGYDTHIIINVNGSYLEEYVRLSERIGHLEKVPAIELNISCPNVKMGGMAFGTNPASAREVIRAVRKVYGKVLIVKLSPNVTNIVEFARIAEEEGADSVSLVNTLLGMAIDIKTRRPKLSTITGGLSGPAIKPVALRMVWQVARAVKIPVIGMGGIMNAEDTIEFLMAGAAAVQIGTATFIEPDAPVKILEGLEKFLAENRISDFRDIIGCVNNK